MLQIKFIYTFILYYSCGTRRWHWENNKRENISDRQSSEHRRRSYVNVDVQRQTQCFAKYNVDNG